MSNVLITGTTGMVGKGILLECLKSSSIQKITLVNRSPVNIKDPKIREIILKDFMEIETIENQLENIDACFHCMGVSSLGMNEAQYSRLTFEITKKLADICFQHNRKMTFNYVSGTGTDSTEKGKVMWARIKGKTENYILAKGFEKAYMFRPGMIIPGNGIKSRTRLYNSIYFILRPFFPLMKKMNNITTTSKIGQAMINTIKMPAYKVIYLENPDINAIVG